MAIVTVEQLFYAYPVMVAGAEPQFVLRGVDLTIERGEFLALMGATGSGKSTLCMALNGLVPHSMGGFFRGAVKVEGRDTRSTSVAQLATSVTIVYQDPESQLFASTIVDELAFGPENLGLPPGEIRARIAWALECCGHGRAREAISHAAFGRGEAACRSRGRSCDAAPPLSTG